MNDTNYCKSKILRIQIYLNKTNQPEIINIFALNKYKISIFDEINVALLIKCF